MHIEKECEIDWLEFELIETDPGVDDAYKKKLNSKGTSWIFLISKYLLGPIKMGSVDNGLDCKNIF